MTVDLKAVVTMQRIEVTTEILVDSSLVQVQEVANSNAMGKKGLKRCPEFLETNVIK